VGSPNEPSSECSGEHRRVPSSGTGVGADRSHACVQTGPGMPEELGPCGVSGGAACRGCPRAAARRRAGLGLFTCAGCSRSAPADSLQVVGQVPRAELSAED